MKILLLGGFLGSGKTTTILQIAKQITEIYKQTVAIIENEIGESGVDDQLLTESGLQVTPLFGGCVCCQITSDLILAIDEIREVVKPHWLIIEMTGLAVPHQTIKHIQQYSRGYTLLKSVTLVDAGRWFELKEVLEPLMAEQIKNSDILLINKVDLTGSELQDAIKDITSLSDAKRIFTITAKETLPLAILKEVLHDE